MEIKTDRQLKRMCRDIGIKMTKVDGEYRITPRKGTREWQELVASYDTDRDAVWGTAQAMRHYKPDTV